MSTYDAGLTPTLPAITSGGLRPDPKPLGLIVPEASAITTYYYRLLDGTRSTSTDVGSIPAGAVVERVS